LRPRALVASGVVEELLAVHLSVDECTAFVIRRETMNKSEKKLAKKILATFQSGPKNDAGFTRDENMIIERWRTHKIINEDAFVDMTSGNSDHKEFLQILEYPFTYFGDQEIKKNWYLHFRESKGITITRDVLTVIAFLVSLFLAISKFFQK
jgi:hypothetical protein